MTHRAEKLARVNGARAAADIAARDQRILELELEGVSSAEIARRLGVRVALVSEVIRRPGRPPLGPVVPPERPRTTAAEERRHILGLLGLEADASDRDIEALAERARSAAERW